MNLRALRYFITLADTRHFSKAAAACFVSQPTLSTQIKKLEDELGVQLVERAPRRVMLTPIGEEIAGRARSVLRDIEEIRMLSKRSRDPAAGTVRIGIFPTLAPYLLPHVLGNIRAAYPKLKIQLLEEKTNDVLRMLQQGQIDVGLLALPITNDNLEVVTLFEEPFLLAMPNNHPLTDKPSIKVDDLSDQELLLLEDGHCLRDQALEVCKLAGAHERMDFHASSMETLRQMVATEAGITLMPTLAVQPPVAATPNLTLRHFDEKPRPTRTIGACWRRSSALREFLHEMAPLFAQLPPGILEYQESDAA
ncbi:MAG: LysR substrate-binding domain-containing protein [Wenzhouxiangellaceae bacterium]